MFSSPMFFSTSANGAFTPLDLFGAGEKGFWLDSTDLSTLWQDTGATSPITADGQALARWDDKSPNGYDWAQSTASARPLYVDDVGGISVSFDGSNDELVIGSVDLLKNVAHAIVAISYRSSAGPTAAFQRHLEIEDAAGNTRSTVWVAPTSSTNRAEVGGRRLDVDSFAAVSTTETKFADNEVYIHNYRYADALIDSYKNNTLLHSTAFQTAGATSNTNASEAAIGGRPTVTDQNAAMSVIEIIVVGRSTAFTAQEISDLNAYMQGKI